MHLLDEEAKKFDQVHYICSYFPHKLQFIIMGISLEKNRRIVEENQLNLPGNMKNLFSKSEINFLDTTIDEGVKRQIKKVSKWKVKNLYIDNCNFCQAVSITMNISFPQLRNLSLQGNNISSLEVFHRISMPSLRYLFLSNNQISDISEIRKINAKYLIGLDLNKNPITNIEKVNEIHGCLNRLLLSAEERVQYQNIHWLAKLPHKQLRLLWISPRQNRLQNRSIPVLESCFLQADIKTILFKKQ